VKNSHTILVVDDDERILDALVRLLRLKHYIVLTALSGIKGLEILNNHRVDLVIAYINMPKMNGIQFLRRGKAQYPETARIVLTGLPNLDNAVKAINEGEVYRFLTKPWNNAELLQAIAQSLDYFDLLRDIKLLIKSFKTRRGMIDYIQKKGDEYMRKAIRSSMENGHDLQQIEDKMNQTVDKMIEKYYPGMNIQWIDDGN
jgi:response regulator RpfG family c-di-GMP phosphodiesterase